MSLSLVDQGLALQQASTSPALRSFHIKHTDRTGNQHEYDALAKDSIEAIKECVAVFGIGRISVKAK
jgi:hypothetical protein